MEFLLELLLTVVVALLFSFLVAKLVSDQAEETVIGDGDGSTTVEELRFGLKMDAPVVHTKRKLRAVVDENVEHVDRFGSGADRVVVDELEEAGKEVELVVPPAEAGESSATVSPENVIAKEMIVSTVEAESTACSLSPENVIAEEERSSSGCVERGQVVVTEAEESYSVEKMELTTEEEQEELSIDEDDDWEGIERSELEKAFASASNLLEESGKGEEIGVEAKMELYGLHKIATEGSCREAQPMAVMVSARAKWNAWQKLGNMGQEDAMEQYLALVSKEFPGLINIDHTLGKIAETETSVVLQPNTRSSEDSTTLDTTVVASRNTANSFQGEYESSV